MPRKQRQPSEERVCAEAQKHRTSADAPEATNYVREKRLAAILEELKAVEDLEYHNMNWLSLDPAKRCAEKRAMLAEAILLTGQRTDVCRYI